MSVPEDLFPALSSTNYLVHIFTYTSWEPGEGENYEKAYKTVYEHIPSVIYVDTSFSTFFVSIEVKASFLRVKKLCHSRSSSWNSFFQFHYGLRQIVLLLSTSDLLLTVSIKLAAYQTESCVGALWYENRLLTHWALFNPIFKASNL